MIQCPICQSANEDKSLFCAECGQRFVTVTRQPLDANIALLSPPIPDAIPKRPTVKLHSPILDGNADERQSRKSWANAESDPISHIKPDDATVNPSVLAPPSINTKISAPEVPPGQARTRLGLNSPLLGNSSAADSESNYSNTSAFPHRQAKSPLNAPPQESKPTRTLRSPLLGGNYDDENSQEDVQSNSIAHNTRRTAERLGRLHSPALDAPSPSSNIDIDPEYLGEEYEQVAEIDDPNVLRSPLLAARSKVTISEAQTTNTNVVPEVQNRATPGQAPNTGKTAASQAAPGWQNVTSKGSLAESDKLKIANRPAQSINLKTDILKTNTLAESAGSSPPLKPNLLPPQLMGVQELNIGKPTTPRRINTNAVVLLLTILLATKVFYLHSLGPTLWSASYTPFLIGELGQLLVIVCLLISA